MVSVPGFIEADTQHAPVQVGIPFPDSGLPRPVAFGLESKPRWVANGTRELRCYAVVELVTFDVLTREWVYRKSVLYPDISESFYNVYAVRQGIEVVGYLRLAVGERINAEHALLVEGPYVWERER